MSDLKIKSIPAIIGLALLATAVFLFVVCEQYRQAPKSVTKGISLSMAIDYADALLQSRKFVLTTGVANDGDKFKFRRPLSSAPDVMAAYYLGTVEDTLIMVRVGHRGGKVIEVTAENLSFEKAG